MARQVLHIAHRGARLEAPENTLASFERALALGADWLELDVRMTSDGHLVVIHDDKLQRTTGAEGRVSRAPLSVLRSLDAGSWFGEEFTGEHIPLLGEVAQCASGRAGLLVEVKSPGERYVEIARRLDEALGGFDRECWVQSFDIGFVHFYKQAFPKRPAAVLTRRVSAVREALEVGADGVSVGLGRTLAVILPRVARAGLKTFAWTINTPRALAAALRLNVDGVITDRPAEARAVTEMITRAEAAEFGDAPPQGKAYASWRQGILRKLRSRPTLSDRPDGARG